MSRAALQSADPLAAVAAAQPKPVARPRPLTSLFPARFDRHG